MTKPVTVALCYRFGLLFFLTTECKITFLHISVKIVITQCVQHIKNKMKTFRVNITISESTTKMAAL